MTRLLTLMLLLLGLAFWMTVQARGDEAPPTPGDAAADSSESSAEPEAADGAEPAHADEAEHADGAGAENADGESGEEPHHVENADAGEPHHENGGHVHAAAITPEEILEEFDADHDGKLDPAELAASLAASHEPGDLSGDPAHGGPDGDDHAGPHEVSPLPFDPDLAIFTVIVFVILLLVLGKFAWGPIIEGLDKRENSVAEQIEQAKENNEKAAAMLAEYEERLAVASNEAKEMVEEARRDSESTRERIVAEAEAAAAREKERALEAIRLAKEAALHDLTKQSVDQAVALAKGIVRREVKAEDHAQLIQETLDKFPSRN